MKRKQMVCKKTVNKQLNEDEKTFCYNDVTEDDIKNVLKIRKCNKSPGEDGIVSEFYQAFWNLIRKELTQIIQYSFNNFTLTSSQYKAMI